VGSTAGELAPPPHPPLDGPVVIRTPVREASEVTVEALEGSGQMGRRGRYLAGGGRDVRCGQETSRWNMLEGAEPRIR
jgi:hypothetical protein